MDYALVGMSRRDSFFHAGVKTVADFLLIKHQDCHFEPSLRRRLIFALKTALKMVATLSG
jgi:hypothetical protein